MLKMPASFVLVPLSCSRTPLYAPLAKGPAALLNGHFEHPALLLIRSVFQSPVNVSL